MLWLFGQIWVWLLIAFLLGALVMWLIMRAARPKLPGRDPKPEPAEVPEPVEAEQTQYIPVTHYDEPPAPVYNDYPEVDPDDPYPAERSGGHWREHTGELPEAEPHLSGELNWPRTDEAGHPGGEWPHEDGPAQPAPRRPGRGG
jgi:hypothetical protein